MSFPVRVLPVKAEAVVLGRISLDTSYSPTLERLRAHKPLGLPSGSKSRQVGTGGGLRCPPVHNLTGGGWGKVRIALLPTKVAGMVEEAQRGLPVQSQGRRLTR